jgi:hypothetical protein
MPNDLTIPAVAANSFGNNPVVKGKAAVVEPTTAADPAPTPPLTINPVMRLDEALGLVVIEFRDDRGAITTSIPSQRQLEAYRRWDDTRLGPMPPGRTDTLPTTPPPVVPQTRAGPSQPETEPVKTDPG